MVLLTNTCPPGIESAWSADPYDVGAVLHHSTKGSIVQNMPIAFVPNMFGTQKTVLSLPIQKESTKNEAWVDKDTDIFVTFDIDGNPQNGRNIHHAVSFINTTKKF